MAIPDYQGIMLPLLNLAGDGEEHSLRETIETLADEFGLTNEERRELLPSGRQSTFDNRVGWARTYMKKAGLLKSTRRGYYQITERGRGVLDEKPSGINTATLSQFPEFVEFQSPEPKGAEEERPEPDDSATASADVSSITGPIRDLEERVVEAIQLGAVAYIPSGRGDEVEVDPEDAAVQLALFEEGDKDA